MSAEVLNGVRSDAMLGYLKAIGLLRVLGQQVDRDVRGSWNDATFVLHSGLERRELERFFLDRYEPSAVFNPWNSGAGFDGKSKTKTAGRTLDAVAATTDRRWQRAREVLALARGVAQRFDEDEGDRAKPQILRALRECYPDDALWWLDAAVVVGRKELDFPRILGTGGNDGRLDFSVNYLQRAMDVVGPKPLADRESLLRDALDGSSLGRLTPDVAIGQYAPASAGGVNASTGFEAVSLVNPWDFVLLIEGIVVFAGSVAKRFGAGRSRAVFPFTFAPTDAGYGTASADEEKRAEIWLPRWRGAATLRAVSQLIRTARVDLETSTDPAKPTPRAAGSAIEAAQAALSRGVAGGIEGFERIVIAQRNGLAFSAPRVGFIGAEHGVPSAAALSREASRWVNRLRGKTVGPAVAAALRAYEAAVFAYASAPARAGLQQWIAALGLLDIAVGHARIEGVEPFRFRNADDARLLAGDLDDGSHEHALAAGFASVGSRSAATSMRVTVAPVAAQHAHFVYDATRAMNPPIAALLADTCVTRLRVARDGPRFTEVRGEGESAVPLTTVAAYLDASIDDRRLARLLAGYVLLPAVTVSDRGDGNPDDIAIAWAAAKVLFESFVVSDAPRLATEAVTLLLAGRAQAALERMYRDLTVALTAASPPLSERRPRDFRFARLDHPQRAVAALLLPINLAARGALTERVLQPKRYR